MSWDSYSPIRQEVDERQCCTLVPMWSRACLDTSAPEETACRWISQG